MPRVHHRCTSGIWNSHVVLICILWKSAQPHPVISAWGHKSISWNHYLWNKKLITCLTWSTCLNPAGGWSYTRNMYVSPPRGEKSKEDREAAVILPGLLSGLQVKGVTPSRSQWRNRPGWGHLFASFPMESNNILFKKKKLTQDVFTF